MIKNNYAQSVTLQDMKQMNIWEQIEQPQIVYHMTARTAAEQILKDNAVKTMTDYICWFFVKIEDIAEYIELTKAKEGREYYGYDGLLHKAPPLDYNNTVILKLKPRYKEPETWFREIISKDGVEPAQHDLIDRFNNCRIAHYGHFKFRTYPEDIEVLELSSLL